MKTFFSSKNLRQSILALILTMVGLTMAGQAEAACKAYFTDTVSGRTIKFYSTSSVANPAHTSYTWKFGDGSKGSGATTYHLYASYGTSYTACLIIVDSVAKCTDSTCATVYTACSASASFKYSVGK